MNGKKKIVLFAAFIILIGTISSFYKKTENTDDSNTKISVKKEFFALAQKSSAGIGIAIKDTASEKDVPESASKKDVPESASEKEVLEPAQEKEAAVIQKEKKKKLGTTEFVCSDEEKNIYLQRTVKKSEPVEPTEILTKDSVIFSPAGKRAELGPVEGWVFSSLNITLEDGTKKECELTNVFFSSISEFRWIDEERVVLEGHRNPSLEVYIVYDLKENSFEEYYGLFFTWNNDYSRLYYVQPSPHFTPESVPEKIVDQDETVYYETNKGEHLVNSLTLDETNEYIGFFVKINDDDGGRGKNFGILNCKTRSVLYEEVEVYYDEVKILVQ